MLTSGGSDSWNVESLQIAGVVPTKNEQEYDELLTLQHREERDVLQTTLVKLKWGLKN